VTISSDTLLAGPQGREFCWMLLWGAMPDADYPEWSAVWNAVYGEGLSGHADDLSACVGYARPGLAAMDDRLMLTAFGRAVDAAAYWQERDHSLDGDEVRDALLPLAELIVQSPATRWWDDPVARHAQMIVEREETGPPKLAGAAQGLAKWRADTESSEQQAFREQPHDPSAQLTGHWWSTPVGSGVPTTTRDLPGAGAVGLGLVEDGLGWSSARSWPVSPSPDARVYEVTSPDSWAALVGRFPLDVSYSRRHDWWRVTGLSGRWLIPDYQAVAAEYDGIHVSAAAYLSVAGRPVAVGDGRTMLAGWDPDETFWLADVLEITGSPQVWEGDGQDAGAWHPSARQWLRGEPG
jgi:hypothetical protein